ncbi:molecular chaperone [Jejubacter calystegiae]|uniref:Molecular chaperone n=1 Tax=Jejubacter calystegiae TaxID=2579935 RepID=A0A4P8YGP9_9ENTR|nr:molecular chaperone [Jejubacter calystegiae]QCT19730.1 molecular chaperone [Jejubacter calystegiae]
MKKIVYLFALLLATGSSWANIVINGTRVIYPEKSKEVIVQLVNNGDDPSLVQSWIDDGDINSTPETARVPFLLSPPVVKVSGHNGQQLRIKKLPALLPGDRESVFYLNVLDIPPVPENLKNQNTVQLAIKSRIKLFYRPLSLRGSLDDALTKMEIQAESREIRLVNNSPFHITVANIAISGKELLLNDAVMVNPFSQASASAKRPIAKGQTIQVKYVDDLGAYKSKSFVVR